MLISLALYGAIILMSCKACTGQASMTPVHRLAQVKDIKLLPKVLEEMTMDPGERNARQWEGKIFPIEI